MSLNPTDIKYYHLDPSLPAACIFTVIFGAAAACHFVLLLKSRLWFCIPMLIGVLLEFGGYLARAISHQQVPNTTIGPYVTQILFLIIAPAFLAASIYSLLQRRATAIVEEQLLPMRARWVTRSFVSNDVVSFLIQMGGAGLMASTKPSTAGAGSHLVLAGLIIQTVIFSCFLGVTAIFHRRLRVISGDNMARTTIDYRCFWLIYISGAAILGRTIVRIAEFAQGYDGYLTTHEGFLYVFDALPMSLVVVIFASWHPSRLLPRSDTQSLPLVREVNPIGGTDDQAAHP